MLPQPQQPTPQLLESLYKNSLTCRNWIVDMLTAANSSHLGCSFSVIDILVVLYHYILNVPAIKQQRRDRDYFILSKGHAASGLYAALASAGIIDPQEFKNYHQGGSYLCGHPTRDVARGIEASTGSLGHGLPMAVGIALAAKQENLPSRVYVIVGDGECQEGSIWEALILAARFKLNNLTIIVDYNNLQGLDKSDDLMVGGLAQRFKAFECTVHSVDGHDHAALINIFNDCGKTEKPDAIIAHTTKGKGISFIENKLEWHYKSFKPDQYELAKQQITVSPSDLLANRIEGESQ